MSYNPEHRLRRIGPNRGDTSVTLQWGMDDPIQLFTTALTLPRTVTLSPAGADNGAWFLVVRTGLGLFALDIGPGLRTIPSATAAVVEVGYDGTAWLVTGYSVL